MGPLDKAFYLGKVDNAERKTNRVKQVKSGCKKISGEEVGLLSAPLENKYRVRP